MNYRERTTDHGRLNIYCLECSRMLSWHKEHLIDDRGFYDWRIVVSCGCGEAQDPELLAIGRAAYDAAGVDEIFSLQEESMRRAIGDHLNHALNRASGLADESGTVPKPGALAAFFV